MLVHNYPNLVDKIPLVSSSDCGYSMTNNTLLTGVLFRQIFTVVLFTSKDFAATIFAYGEKAIGYQTHNQATEIKEANHMILTFSPRSNSCVQILL